MPSRIPPRSALRFAAVALVLAACGGGRDNPRDSGPDTLPVDGSVDSAADMADSAAPARGTPTKLVILQQPTTVTAGDPFEITIAVADSLGNPVKTASAVAVGLAQNPVGAPWSVHAAHPTTGLLVEVQPAVQLSADDAATRVTLSVSEPGTGFVFVVRANGLSSASTAPIEAKRGAWSRSSAGMDGLANVWALAAHPTQRGTVYASYFNGLYRTVDGGATWRAVGPGGLAAFAIAFDAMTGDVFAAAGMDDAGAGLFRSKDGGVTWDTLDPTPGIRAVDVHPSGREIVTAGRNGIRWSDDGGETWHRATGTEAIATRVARAPDDRRVLFASGDGVWKSVDGGRTWKKTALSIWVRGMAVTTLGGRAIHTVMAEHPWHYLRSDDDGATWTKVENGPKWGVTGHGGGKVLVGSTGDAFARSTDGGLTWTPFSDGLPTGSNAEDEIAIDPTDSTTVYGHVGGGIYRTNGAGVWSRTSSGLKAPGVLSLAAHRTAPDVIYAGTYAGVFKSVDGAASWSRINTGLGCGSVRSIEVDPTNANRLYALCWTDVYRSVNGGATWAPTGKFEIAGTPVIDGVSTLDVAIDGTVYAATNKAAFRSTDAGVTWSLMYGEIKTDRMISLLTASPHDATTVFLGSNESGCVEKSTDRGATWNPVGSDLPCNVGGSPGVFAFHPDPATRLVYYVGGRGGLRESTDGGSSWRLLPGVSFAALTLAHDGVAYAANHTGGVTISGQPGIVRFEVPYRATTLQQATGGMDTGQQINGMLVDPSRAGTVYAATPTGVFKTTTGGR